MTTREERLLQARADDIERELRSRRSTSAIQADVARTADNRDADDEAPDDELSTSEAQARRSAAASGRGWRTERGA